MPFWKRLFIVSMSPFTGILSAAAVILALPYMVYVTLMEYDTNERTNRLLKRAHERAERYGSQYDSEH
jgi:hypothetical protein